MVAFTSRVDFRTNLSSSINLRQLITRPRKGQITRINWFQWYTESEAGDFLHGDSLALVEGPLPVGFESGIGIAINGFRDALSDREQVNAIVLVHPTGDENITPVDITAPTTGFHPYPGGVWSVQEIWAGWATSGGVERASFTVGYQTVSISVRDWIRFSNVSPNRMKMGELIQ